MYVVEEDFDILYGMGWNAELMLLGFISLLLTVFQGVIRDICIPSKAASVMLPCNKIINTEQPNHLTSHFTISRRARLLLEASGSSNNCAKVHNPTKPTLPYQLPPSPFHDPN